MTPEVLYMGCGGALVALALFRLATVRARLRQIMALNLLAVGIAAVFLVSGRTEAGIDAVPQAFVLTGIVVLVAVTAALLALSQAIAEADTDG